MKKALATLFITVTIAGVLTIKPKKAEADVLDFTSGAACDAYAFVYENTVKKITDALKKKGEDKIKQEAEKRVGSKVKDKIKDKTGIDLNVNTSVPVYDILVKQKIEERSKEEVKETVKLTCKESVRRFLIATFKKRILDKMADQIIEWIQNGNSSKPRFLTDTEGFLADAGKEAVGDVALEVAPFLCSPFRADIQIGLMQPGPFSEKAQCTLDSITNNINEFGRSFESAGWIGYYELLKPQNNRWGAELLAQDEAYKRVAAKTEAARMEALIGQGYLGSQRCLEWSFIDKTKQVRVSRIASVTTPDLYYEIRNPKSIPTLDEALQKALPPGSNIIPAETVSRAMNITREDLLDYAWKCENKEITTPGKLVGDLLTKGVTADIDYVINAEDLSDYLAAFADAAISRVTKEAISGIKDMYKGGTSDSKPRGESGSGYTCDNFLEVDSNGLLSETPLSKACRANQKEALSAFQIPKENLSGLLDEAETAISSTEATIAEANNQITRLVTLIGQETDARSTSLMGCLKNANKQDELDQASTTLDAVLTEIIPYFSTSSSGLTALRTEIANARIMLNNTPPYATNEEITTWLNNTIIPIHNKALELTGGTQDELETIERLITQIETEMAACLSGANP